MNVIDVGCSFIKSYVVQNDHVVNFERIPTNFDTLKEDTMRLFDRSARDHTQSSIVISTSDSVVWEDNNGNATGLNTNSLDIGEGDQHPTTRVDIHRIMI